MKQIITLEDFELSGIFTFQLLLDDDQITKKDESPLVMLNTVSLLCSTSGLERDSSEPDGPYLTGKL